MIIAIDYDDTITSDQRTWETVMNTLSLAGHTVYVVTGRLKDNTKGMQWLHSLPSVTQVYWTDYEAKKRFMEEEGIEVDVWIDDRPESILYDLDKHSYTLENPIMKEGDKAF